MPKRAKKVVYWGNSDEQILTSRGRTLVLKKGIVTTVSDADYEYLMGCKKTLQVAPIFGEENNYARKLKNRMIKEG